MSEQDLNKLLDSAKANDREAFGQIYDHFNRPIYRFIFFRIGHKEVAEDILSDTFVKAWAKIGQVSSSKSLSGWLYQIAKNNIIDYYRVRKSLIALEEVEEFLLEDAVSPVDEVNLELEQKKLLELIILLPKDQQQVIKYKFFEDLTNEQIALILNKTEGAIRVVQHRAIIKLKELVKKNRII